MNAQKLRVAVVAPVHNRRDITLQCLRSLRRIDTDGLQLDVIIVDDGSTDGTAEAIRSEFPEVDLVEADGSLFFTEGTNAGVRRALERSPDYVLMMNDDQVFDAGFLRSMVETAERHPRTVVGPLLLLWDTPHKLFQVAPRWETASGGWRHWAHQTIWTVPAEPFEVDLIVGNCVLVPAAAIRECGLMDSARYPNFGDAEYTPRLKRNGWRLIIDPRSRVFCQPNNVPARVARMSIGQKLNALLFDLKHIHNLRRRFYAYWDTAPTKSQAIAAFTVFFVRLALRRNAEGSWAATQSEVPLRELYKDATLAK